MPISNLSGLSVMRKLMLAAVAVCGISATARAQVISTGSWTNLSAISVNNSASDAFWDQRSSDGSRCNIGHYLTGSFGPCSNVAPIAPSGNGVGELAAGGSFLGGADLNGARSFSFAAGVYQIDFFDNIAGYGAASGQSLLAYVNGGPSEIVYERQVGVGTPMYSTLLNATAGDWFFGANSFGNGTTGQSRFSNAVANGEFNRFTIFSTANAADNPESSGTWYVGFEDNAFGDSDFNDLLLRVSLVEAAVVPEPSSAMLALIALGALSAAARRRAGNKVR